MKYLLIPILIALYSFAAQNYTSGKIDMHGGKKIYTNNKSGFSQQSMGMSNFLDKNSTKDTNSLNK